MTDMPIRRLVVVGASLAGLRAVEAARKAGFAGEIVLIGAEPHLPYDRPPLSKNYQDASDGLVEPDAPTFRTSEDFESLGVELLLGQRATGIDVGRRMVLMDDREVSYDALVIATGSRPRLLPGSEHLSGVHVLRSLDDARHVRAALDRGARTVVIGAGFIGSELASSARKRGLDVTIVEALPTPLVRAVGPEMGSAIASLHERHGTRLLCGSGVAAVEGDEHVERVVLADGTELPADLVVVGIGVVPDVEWLEGSGLTLDNGIVCDENLWTGIPGVFAAGDVANWPNAAVGERQRMENWTAAAEQGAAAARNAVSPDGPRPYSTVPYYWSDWYDLRIQFVGSPLADEVLVVDGDASVGDRWVALYRRGDRLIGALAVNAPTEIMKYRVQIMKGGSWQDALDFADSRRRAREAKLAVAQS